MQRRDALSAFLPSNLRAKTNASTKPEAVASPSKNQEKPKDDLLASFLPTSFGKKRQRPAPSRTAPVDPYDLSQFSKKKQKHSRATDERPAPSPRDTSPSGFMGPPDLPPPSPEQASTPAKQEENEYPLPVSECALLKGHSGPVISLALDPSGSRLLSGSEDFHLHFWDFAGMMSNFRSFRSVEVEEGHPVGAIEWNETGSQFLVAPGTLNARLYDRDGHMVSDYVKGDPYITDMQHTKGHVGAICSAAWDVEDPTRFLTASRDSTIRIWDVERTDKHDKLIRVKNAKNTRVAVTTMHTSPWECTSRNMIVAGCMDGSLQLWSMQGNHRTPATTIRGAHQNQMEVADARLSRDGNLLVSRGTDDTLKFWDLRKPNTPWKEFHGLENISQHMNVCFSPDENLLLTGTTVRPGHGAGKLLFFDLKAPGGVQPYHEIEVDGFSVLSMVWHRKLNQIMVGCGDKHIRVFHSPTLSQRGVLMGKSKDPSKKKVQGYVTEEMVNIHTPNSLASFRPEPSSARQKIKDRRNPTKSKKPDVPLVVGNKGHSGQVGSGLSQYLVRNMILIEEQVKDPREALLRYADSAKNDPKFFGDAYKHTQPETIFEEAPEEEEDDTVGKSRPK